MKVNFNDYERTAQPNFRGGEGEYVSRMLNDGTNKVIWGMLAPGHSIGMHTHETNSETMFFLTGKGKMYFPDGSYGCRPRRCVLLSPRRYPRSGERGRG